MKYREKYGYNNSIHEVLDRVSTHLMTQNKPAKIDDTGECHYRLYEDGKVLKCAVGCLIPDEDYNRNLEGHIIDNQDVRNALPERFRNPETLQLLQALQRVHDHLTPTQWPAALFAVSQLHDYTNIMVEHALRAEGASL